MKKNLTLLAVLLFVFTTVNAKIKLPALVADNMVLQQNTQVKIWGWCNPNATVEISPSWRKKVKVNADKAGNWIAIIQTQGASFQNQTITISDGESITLNNILIGEVWLVTGQSNMQIEVQGRKDCPIEGSQDITVESAQFPDVRLFTVKLKGSLEKQEEVSGDWQVASPTLVKKFSAIGYFFGRNFQKNINVPIGIINISCGGTWIETWFPADLQKKFSDFDPASIGKKGLSGFDTSEILYNGMIYPLHNYTIKGFLWYQGESNVGNGNSNYNYADKMFAMINNWREIWGGEKNHFITLKSPPTSMEKII